MLGQTHFKARLGLGVAATAAVLVASTAQVLADEFLLPLTAYEEASQIPSEKRSGSDDVLPATNVEPPPSTPEVTPTPASPGVIPTRKPTTAPVTPAATGWKRFLQNPLASLFGPQRRQRRSSRQLASAPDMFGDTSMARTFDLDVGGVFVPSRILSQPSNKIADNGTASVKDRVYFDYRHFHNAYDFGNNNESVQRYTFGFETPLGESGDWSLETRVPIIGGDDFTIPAIDYNVGDIGNVGVIVKHVIHRSDDTVVSAGLGINTPTGSDTKIVLPQFPGGVARLTLENRAVHLQPFLGFLTAPDDAFFLQGFLQVDVATNGDRVMSEDVVNGLVNNGSLSDQTLLNVDLSGGYWLFRNDHDRCGCGGGSADSLVSGVAAVVELHYTSTLQDTDGVNVVPLNSVVTDLANRFDVLNLTVGAHLELDEKTALRIGTTLPLRDSDNRFFDAEVIATLMRQF